MESTIHALAKQQAEHLANKCAELANTLEAVSIMFESLNNELKKCVTGDEKTGSVEGQDASKMPQTKRGSKRSK